MANMLMDAIIPTKEELERIKKRYPIGCRVRLIHMDDEQAPQPGTLGTVRHIDDIGTVFVNWDTGGSLGLVYKVDRFAREK